MTNQINTKNLDKIIKRFANRIDKILMDSFIFIHKAKGADSDFFPVSIKEIGLLRSSSCCFYGNIINNEFICSQDCSLQLCNDDIERCADSFASFIIDSHYNEVIFLSKDEEPYLYNRCKSKSGVIVTWILMRNFMSKDDDFALKVQIGFTKYDPNSMNHK